MTEHDGLTDARAEAERRYPQAMPTKSGAARSFVEARAFIEGAKWATEREKARAEAAEAALKEIVKLCEYPHRGFASRPTALAIMRIAERALATPTTEAVTEVEGS